MKTHLNNMDEHKYNSLSKTVSVPWWHFPTRFIYQTMVWNEAPKWEQIQNSLVCITKQTKYEASMEWFIFVTLKGSYYAFHFLNFSQCVVCFVQSTKLQISKSTPKGDISFLKNTFSRTTTNGSFGLQTFFSGCCDDTKAAH